MSSTDPKPPSPSSPSQSASSSPFTTLSRIQDLNQIDSTIAQLLRAAGTAIQHLGSNSSAPSLPSAKAQFLDSVTTYFTLLSSIDVRLRRQVYALQEAGLIAEGDAKDAKRGASAAATAAAAAGGGSGQLDVSWLNSRGDQVEKDMEREVWGRAREFVEILLLQEQTNGHAQAGRGDGEMDDGGVDRRHDDAAVESMEDVKHGG
jgi:Mediator complex protein